MEIRQLEARDHDAVERFLARIPEGDRTFFKEDVERPGGGRRLVAARRGAVASRSTTASCVGYVARHPAAGLVEPRRRGAGDRRSRPPRPRASAARSRSYAVLEALSLGLRKMVVEVVADQEATIAMFRSLGFEPEALLDGSRPRPGRRDARPDGARALRRRLVRRRWPPSASATRSAERREARRRAPGRRRRPRARRDAPRSRRRSATASASSPTRELDERSSRLAQALLAAGVGAGLARRLPRPHGARDRRAAVRDEQDRRRHRAAQLAAGAGASSRAVARRRAAAGPDRRRGVRGGRGGARRSAGADADRRRAATTSSGSPPTTPSIRARAAESGDTVLQLYTSGTTGVPKGVLTTHRNLAAAAETSPYWEFDADSVSLTPLPMFHIGGIGWAFLGLWNGATTVLVQRVRRRRTSSTCSSGSASRTRCSSRRCSRC